MNASWDGGVSCTILWVTVTLTSDLVFLILLKVKIPNLVCGVCGVSHTIFGSL